MQEKDEETIKIASRLARAVVVPKKPDLPIDRIDPERYIQDTMYEGLPEPGKILAEELVKVLYLNNLEPKKVKMTSLT